MGDAAPDDERLDAALPQQAAVLVVVVSAVGVQPLWPVPGSASQSSYAGDRIEKRDQLGDVVPVPAGQRGSERGAAVIDEYMVLGAGTASVDRRRSNMVPPNPICRRFELVRARAGAAPRR